MSPATVEKCALLALLLLIAISHLAFLATRKSMLDFRQQSVIGSLADTGKLTWQYRSSEVVTLLGHASLNSNIVIGTGKQIGRASCRERV